MKAEDVKVFVADLERIRQAFPKSNIEIRLSKKHRDAQVIIINDIGSIRIKKHERIKASSFFGPKGKESKDYHNDIDDAIAYLSAEVRHHIDRLHSRTKELGDKITP